MIYALRTGLPFRSGWALEPMVNSSCAGLSDKLYGVPTGHYDL